MFTEVPYQVNKERVLEKIGELARSKQIEGIAGANDESDREGVRLVVEVKRDADPEVVLNQLFRFTQLQTSFGVNMLALNGGRPEQMGLLDVLKAFLAFREQIIVRRTAFLLEEARGKAHTLAGLAVAVANIDEVVALIRHASGRRRRAGRADGTRLAGGRRRAADRADRGTRPPGRRRRRLPALRSPGARHPGPAGCIA